MVLLATITVGCTDPNRPTTAEETAAPATAEGKNRYIVLLKEGGETSLRANAVRVDVARLGGKLEREHAEIGVLQIGGLTAAAAAQVARQANVEAVVKDRKVQWLPPREQRIKAFRRLGLHSQGNQRGAAFFDQFQWNLRQIKAPRAWDVSREGRGVLVCILDTGVDPRHIDLQGKLNVAISASFVAQERADRDQDSHGTFNASLVSSKGIGMASVAPDARLCSVKVLDRTGSGTFSDLAAGIMYVGTVGTIEGGPRVAVANMSLGALLPRNDPDVRALTRAMQRAVNFSTRQGVLFVAAAGNQEANLNNPNFIHLPSQLDNVISVGATGPIGQERFDRIASYSNVGREGVDVFAPGGELGFPRSVIEDAILSACSPGIVSPFFKCTERDAYIFGIGTSHSAALVSGEAAVIESELPGNQSPAELTACILQNADRLPNPLITARGRINVLRAQDCGAPGNLVAGR